MRPALVALALAVVGCASAHPGGGDETAIGIWARLPGATVTIEGESATLDRAGVAMIVRPAIADARTVLHIEAAGASLELPVDWSADYDFLGLEHAVALDALTIGVLRASDGACVVGTTNGRAAGHAWSGEYADPIAPCGPFGLVRFRRDRAAGPCPPGDDCAGFEEITGDGLLRVDPFFGEPGAPIVEARLSDVDRERVRATLDDPALMDLLAGDRPCPPITDSFETMRLEWLLESAENETPHCDAPELVAVRALLDDLTARYAP